MENQNQIQKQARVVVVMVPLLAQGHLNQLLHLAHLIASYALPIHYIGSSTHIRQAKLRLHGWSSINTLSNIHIHFHDFQLPSQSNHSNNQPVLEASTYLRQPTSDLLRDLSKEYERIVVIHDALMASVVQDVRVISNAEAYVFDPISAFTSLINTWQNIPHDLKPFNLDSTHDFPEFIPTSEGCVPLEVMELALKEYSFLGFESGWIYNTSRVIEGRYVELQEKLHLGKGKEVRHFALGPFNPVNVKTQGEEKRHECLRWLDEQEKGEVIYVAFGSTTSMENDQIEELANALEKCGVKFIWVLREADQFDIFVQGSQVLRIQLPQGYEERVKGRGLVVRDWAPQLEILAHSSIGGFMSHCGWNSCMESISMGVPILAWPMVYDQPRNATLICEVLKIGMIVRAWIRRSDLVMSSTIESAIRTLMTSKEGKEMKKSATKLGEVVKGSVTGNGVTCLERNDFINYITRSF